MGQTPPRDPIPAPKPPAPPADRFYRVRETEALGTTPKFDAPPTPDDRARFDKWAMPSCRCDAEAAQDFAQLELSRKRLAKAERATAAERARKWCFILAIPTAFFAGLLLAVLMVRSTGFGTSTTWAVLVGCFLGFVAVGAGITWAAARTIARKIDYLVSGGLWG